MPTSPPCQPNGSRDALSTLSRTGRRRAWVASRHDSNRRVESMAQPNYQVTDPATGEVAESFPFVTDAEVDQAMADAASTFAQWSARPMEERVAIAKRVAGLFAERSDELARLAAREMGKAL